MDLGITTKEFLEEYYILLGNPMYGNVDAAILWLRLISKYLMNVCNKTRSNTDYCIFYKKYDNGQLELVMYVLVDNSFMPGRPEILEYVKGMINLKFNIQEYGKVKKFLSVYYEWDHDAKGPYAKKIMEKDINKLVDGYKKFIGSDEKI